MHHTHGHRIAHDDTIQYAERLPQTGNALSLHAKRVFGCSAGHLRLKARMRKHANEKMFTCSTGTFTSDHPHSLKRYAGRVHTLVLESAVALEGDGGGEAGSPSTGKLDRRKAKRIYVNEVIVEKHSSDLLAHSHAVYLVDSGRGYSAEQDVVGADSLKRCERSQAVWHITF